MSRELTVGRIEKALKKKRARVEIRVVYGVTRLTVTFLVRGENQSVEVVASGFEEAWEQFFQSRPDWLEEGDMLKVGFTKAVQSSKGGAYTVSFVQEHSTEEPKWVCECKGFLYRGKCRHVDEVSLEVQNADGDEKVFSVDDGERVSF